MEAADVSQGVTIVMNPQTGEILAMVSLPAYDNNAFAGGISVDDFNVYLADPDLPLRNHAISRHLPARLDVQARDRHRRDGGGRDHRRAASGRPTAATRSPARPTASACTTGTARASVRSTWSTRSPSQLRHVLLSDGRADRRRPAWRSGPTSSGSASDRDRLPDEAEGIIASTEWAHSRAGPGVFTGEVAQAGIGQNVIAVTPLQLLNAYAAVANGGRLMRPMIVRGEADASGEPGRALRARACSASWPPTRHTCRRCASAPAR